MNLLDSKLELMSPAGNFTSLQAAIDNKCDSIYFGVEQLNMRARANINFTINDLNEIVNRCEKKNIKTYLTINTIIYDHDFYIVKKLIKKAKQYNINAIIAMDQSVINYANNLGVNVHISTQVNITNIETVKFYSKFADTIVLSRELTLSQIQKITKQIKKQNIKGPSGELIKIEIFAHGALCMAISGKCYLSLHSHNSSANRGACKQNCRKKYILIDQESGFEVKVENEYMMSAKDLCTINFLDQIIKSGVKVLKIEGRGRSPEYVGKVTKCYKEAINSILRGKYTKEKINFWIDELSTVYNRGFWDGYYLGRKLGEWSKNSGNNSKQKKIYIGKGKHYYSQKKIAEFEIEAFSLSLGDKILIQGPTTGSKESIVKSLFVNNQTKEKAVKGEISTFPLNFSIRSSDKLYKIVKN